jgi:hypothetical protein
VLLLAGLAGRSAELPRWVSPLGLALGIFLVLTFLARLVVLDPSSALVPLPGWWAAC